MKAYKTLQPIPDAFFNPLYKKLKLYYVTDDMPEPVLMLTQERATETMQIALSNIISSYERDFGKHPERKEFAVTPRYWSQVNPSYEVNFIIQRENNIIPVEVKSEANIQAKSLKQYKEKFGDQVKIRIRFSLDNLKLDNDVLNIPLFMADKADHLIGLALKQLI